MDPSRHIKRLKTGLRDHPGVLMATFFTIVGAVAGVEGGVVGSVIGALIMSVFWLPVLVTAYQQGDRDQSPPTEGGSGERD